MYTTLRGQEDGHLVMVAIQDLIQIRSIPIGTPYCLNHDFTGLAKYPLEKQTNSHFTLVSRDTVDG